MTCILPGDLAVFTVAGGSPWDPTTAGGPGVLTFSNANRTVTGASSSTGSCKGKRNRGTSGRYYFEIKANVVSTAGIDVESAGLVDSGWAASVNFVGQDADSVGIVAVPGTAYLLFTNAANIGNFGAVVPVNGDVFGFVVDGTGVDTELWFSLNGIWLGTGTTTFPGFATPDLTWGVTAASALWPATTNDSTSTHTLNTGQQAFAHTPPAGVVAWG